MALKRAVSGLLGWLSSAFISVELQGNDQTWKLELGGTCLGVHQNELESRVASSSCSSLRGCTLPWPGVFRPGPLPRALRIPSASGCSCMKYKSSSTDLVNSNIKCCSQMPYRLNLRTIKLTNDHHLTTNFKTVLKNMINNVS